jgi:hypothetical protein
MKAPKMTVRRGLAVALAVMGIVLAACGSGAKTATAKIAELSGTVTVNGAAATGPRDLSPNDKVQVAQGAFARIAYPDGTKVLLVGRTAEGSELTIGATTEDKGLMVLLVKLGKGALSFVVPPEVKGKARYEIEAVSSLTVVRGTEGKVETGAVDKVALKTGEVEVMAKQGGATRTLPAGQQLTVSSSGEIAANEAYDFSADGDVYKAGILMKTITH